MNISKKILKWLEEKGSGVFRGVDVDADSEPGSFPESIKIHDRVISKRPDGLTLGNASLFCILGLAVRSLFKHFESYYATSMPVVESWPMDAIYMMIGPEKSKHWLSTNPLSIKYIQASIGWAHEGCPREFADLSDFRDKYLEQPRRTGMSHGVFSNPDIRVHVLDFAPIESKPIEKLRNLGNEGDFWMQDDPPAVHHGCLIRTFIIENKSPIPLEELKIFLRVVNEAGGGWYLHENNSIGKSVWFVDQKSLKSKKKKNENVVFAWDLAFNEQKERDVNEHVEKDDGVYPDNIQEGGLGFFSGEIIGYGEWYPDLGEEFLDEDLDIKEPDVNKHVKSGVMILKPKVDRLLPGESCMVSVAVVPARESADLSKLKDVLQMDPFDLLISTASWWEEYLALRQVVTDNRKIQDFIEMAQVMIRLHYGPGDLSSLFPGSEASTLPLGRTSRSATNGQGIAPKAIFLGSHYYDHRDAFVRDNYWVARAFLSCGRLEECLNSSLFFAEAFKLNGTRNAYSIINFYKQFIASVNDEKEALPVHDEDEKDTSSLETKTGKFTINYYPEDAGAVDDQLTTSHLQADKIPADLYRSGGGSSREYRMEVPAYLILMLRDIDVHLNDPEFILSWLPLIENYVKLAGICENNLHVILSDETWIWPCRIRDVDYHVDNTILLLAAFKYLNEKLGKILEDNGSKSEKIHHLRTEVLSRIQGMETALQEYYSRFNQLALSVDKDNNANHTLITNEVCRPFIVNFNADLVNIEDDNGDDMLKHWRKSWIDALINTWSANQHHHSVRSDSRTNAYTGNSPGYMVAALARIDSIFLDKAMEGLINALDSTASMYEIHDVYDDFWGTEKRRLWDTSTCLMGIQDAIIGFNPGIEFLEVAPHFPPGATIVDFLGYPYKGALYGFEMKKRVEDNEILISVKKIDNVKLFIYIKSHEKNLADLKLSRAMKEAASSTPDMISIRSKTGWRIKISDDKERMMIRPEIPVEIARLDKIHWLVITKERDAIVIHSDRWDHLVDAEIMTPECSFSVKHEESCVIVKLLKKSSSAKKIKVTRGEKEKIESFDLVENESITIDIKVRNEHFQKIIDNLLNISPTFLPWFSDKKMTMHLPGFLVGYLPSFIPELNLAVTSKKGEVLVDTKVFPPLFFIPKDTSAWFNGEYPGRSALEARSKSLMERQRWWLSDRAWAIQDSIEIDLKGFIKKKFSSSPAFWDAWPSIIENSRNELDIKVYFTPSSRAAAMLTCQELLMLTQKHPECQPLTGNEGTRSNLENLGAEDLKRVNIFLSENRPSLCDQAGTKEILSDNPILDIRGEFNFVPIEIFMLPGGPGEKKFLLWNQTRNNVLLELKNLFYRLQTCTQPKRRHAIASYPYGLYLLACLYGIPVSGKVKCMISIKGLNDDDEFVAGVGDQVISSWNRVGNLHSREIDLNFSATPKPVNKKGNWLSITISNEHVPMEIMAFKGASARPIAMVDISCDAVKPVELEIEMFLTPNTWLIKLDPGDQGQWSRIDDPVRFARKADGTGLLSFKLHCGTPIFPLNKSGRYKSETLRRVVALIGRFPDYTAN
ncbi:MAG: hypothetical protein ACTSVI_02480 [Promethearchaeota archaeon]